MAASLDLAHLQPRYIRRQKVLPRMGPGAGKAIEPECNVMTETPPPPPPSLDAKHQKRVNFTAPAPSPIRRQAPSLAAGRDPLLFAAW